MDHRLAAAIVRASACRCGARIGQKCRDRRYGVPARSPHPTRQHRAGERFPKIAAALAEAKAAKAARLAAISMRQLQNAAALLETLPLRAVAKRYRVAVPTLRKYLKRAGLYKPAAHFGQWKPGQSGNPKGRPSPARQWAALPCNALGPQSDANGSSLAPAAAGSSDCRSNRDCLASPPKADGAEPHSGWRGPAQTLSPA